MSMLLPKRKYKSQEEAFATAGRGRYIKKEPPSPSVKDYYGVQRPPPKRRSEQVVSLSTSGSRNITNARSLSVPSLRTNVDQRVKESPPLSPAKPRSTSVRLNPRKTLSFKKFRKMFDFGSRSELEDKSGLRNDDHMVGTYHKLPNRPRSIGSDCSNSSYTYTTDFSRGDSFRVSSHSRVSHGVVDAVFDRHRQLSYDSSDYISHAPSASTDSNLRPYSVAIPLPRSSSSSSLKTYGLQTRTTGDYRHHSIAAMPANSTEVSPSTGSFGASDDRSHRRQVARAPHRSQEETAESLWEDSHSFDFSQTPVLPSHPEYPQIAQDLMTASPPRRNSAEMASSDVRRMSDTSTTVDPRRVSNDSGVESSKPFRSQPSTPVAQTLISVRTEGTSSPEMHTSPHDYLSQGSSVSPLPQGWSSATTPQGVAYYLDHNTQTSHWKLPDNPTLDESTSLPTGWEIVQSSRYGTYYVNHNNKTAMYQHPYHSRPPPPYHRVPHSQDNDQWSAKERKPPPRSHSYRDTQNYRVVDPNASLPRRSKSFKDQETQNAMAAVWHSKQLSTVTYVPPSPYQIAEIPSWLKEYVETPFGSDMERSIPWNHYSYEDLNGLDTMIKRMLRKGSEQIVRQFEYYRAAMDQEVNSRGTMRHRRPINQLRRGSSSNPPSHFQYPGPPGVHSAYPTPHSPSPHSHNHTSSPVTLPRVHNIASPHPSHPHPSQQPHPSQPPPPSTPTVNYTKPHDHKYASTYATSHVPHAAWTTNGLINPQLAVYPSCSSSEHSNSSTRTLKARFSDLDLLQDTEETFV